MIKPIVRLFGSKNTIKMKKNADNTENNHKSYTLRVRS